MCGCDTESRTETALPPRWQFVLDQCTVSLADHTVHDRLHTLISFVRTCALFISRRGVEKVRRQQQEIDIGETATLRVELRIFIFGLDHPGIEVQPFSLCRQSSL